MNAISVPPAPTLTEDHAQWTLGHDLAEALTPLWVQAKLLQGRDGDETAQRGLEIILRSAERAQRVLDDMRRNLESRHA